MIMWDVETNLIVKREHDGSIGVGDSAAETMRYYHLMWCLKHFNIRPKYMQFDGPDFFMKAVMSIRQSEGLYVRHPNTPKEWGDPTLDFSRDQAVPLLLALGCYNQKGLLYEFRDHNFFSFANGDVWTPEVLGAFNKSIDKSSTNLHDAFFWPTVLTRCGVIPFWDSGLKKWMKGNPDDVADVLNLFHLFLQCEYKGHTYMSRRAKAYWIKHQVITHGTYELQETNPIMGAIAWYYRKDNPELVELYRPLVEMFFSSSN